MMPSLKWTFIKVGAAHIFGDYGAQTSNMAICKNRNTLVRTQHAGMVPGATLPIDPKPQPGEGEAQR